MLAGSSQNSHFTNLNTLLVSQDIEDASDQIWDYLGKFPDAVNTLFLVERNILHMAILKKKVDLVKKLLDHHPVLLYQCDKSQQVALHHAMVSYDDAIATMLIQAAPEQVDAQRNDGRTPLHLALSLQVPSAIERLIRAKANIYIPDYHGNSPYLIAKESQNAFGVMRVWEDMLFEPPTSVLASQSDTAIDELSRKFSLLKIEPGKQSLDHALDPVGQSGINHHTSEQLAVPLSDVVNGDINKLQTYLSQGGDPNAKHILERPLLVCLFLKATHVHDSHDNFDAMQANKFLHLAKYALLSKKDRGDRNLFDYFDSRVPGKVKLLNQLFSQSREHVGKLMLQYTSSMHLLNEEFMNILLFAGLQKLKLAYNIKKIGPPEKPAPAPENSKHVIDLLCKGITPYNIDRNFDAEYVSNMTCGILSSLTAHEILSHLQSKWSVYSLEQKLIVNFMVKELLILDFIKDSHVISAPDIEFILRGNVETFPMHALKLNAMFDRLFQFRELLLSDPVYHNYKMLSKWYKENPLDNIMPSFFDFIRTTVNLPHNHQRKLCIRRIADELSRYSCNSFTSIAIDEFYNKAWSGREAHELSPNIMSSIKGTNDLVNFIKEVIVNASEIQEARRFYELFVCVAAEMCRSKSPSGPDMAGVFIIMGALNSSNVDRLKKAFGDIDKGTAKKIDLLNKFIKPGKNYIWLRKAESAHHVSIPYLGKLLTDITFIYDGNDNWVVACEMLGMKFKKFMAQQACLLPAPIVQTTDLIHFMKTYSILSEERMYELSTRMLPPEITIDSHSLSQLLFTINNYINDKVVPNVNFNGKNYKGHMIVGAIFAQLKKQLLKEKGSATFNEDIIKSRKMIGELILLVNSRNPEVTVNYLTYTFQLHEIKDSVVVPKLELPVEPIIFSRIEKSISLPEGVARSSSSPEKAERRKSKKNSARL